MAFTPLQSPDEGGLGGFGGPPYGGEGGPCAEVRDAPSRRPDRMVREYMGETTMKETKTNGNKKKSEMNYW